MRLGILSDTHGLLRPEVIAALANVDQILHAGDVGDDAILDRLSLIASLTAIRGNIDKYGRCAELPPAEAVEIAGNLFYLVHSIHDLDLDPVAAGVSCVLSGHSHKASVETRNGVLYMNPGSCGPRRFKLPVTMAYLELNGANLQPALLDLNPA